MSLDNKIQITCSGENSSNHPKVFITFKRDKNETRCTYCTKLFKKSDYQYIKHDDHFSHNTKPQSNLDA